MVIETRLVDELRIRAGQITDLRAGTGEHRAGSTEDIVDEPRNARSVEHANESPAGVVADQRVVDEVQLLRRVASPLGRERDHAGIARLRRFLHDVADDVRGAAVGQVYSVAGRAALLIGNP